MHSGKVFPLEKNEIIGTQYGKHLTWRYAIRLTSDLNLIDASIRQVREIGDIIVYNRRRTTIFLYSGSHIPTYTDDFLSRCCVDEHTSTGLRWSTLDVIYLRCNAIDYNFCDSVYLFHFLLTTKKTKLVGICMRIVPSW